jgi:hypothetical protein
MLLLVAWRAWRIRKKADSLGMRLKLSAWIYLTFVRGIIVYMDLSDNAYRKDLLIGLTFVNLALFYIAYTILEKELNAIFRIKGKK